MRRPLGLFLLLSACSSDPADVVAPVYPRCPSIEGMPLSEKAAHFDRLVIERHQPDGQDLIHSFRLSADLSAVERYDLSDNAGGWSGVYGASQAFRYAVTKEPEALAQVKRILRAQQTLARVTGRPGLFARAYVNLNGDDRFPNEAQLLASYPNCDLSADHCKRWTKIETGPDAGLMFKNDVSKDEYAGHMFALGVMAKVVDDPEVKAGATALVRDVAHHLIDNDLRFVDIDDRPTTFGFMSPVSLNDFPGFNALLVLSWFKVATVLTGEPRLIDFYEGCLLQQDLARCEKPDLTTSEPFTDHLRGMGLDLGCQTNWNNHHMANLSMFSLLQYETGAARPVFQSALERQMWSADDPFPMRIQENSMFTFFYEIQRPPSAPQPTAELDTAVCILKKFPLEKYQRAIDTSATPSTCTDRNGSPLSSSVIPFEQREMDSYMWKKNPFEISTAAEERRQIESPEDFLLAYWTGRFYGLLPADL